MKLAVLLSGTGTNLQSVLDVIAGGALRASVSVCVSNVAGAQGLVRAEAFGIPTHVLSHKAFAAREAFDEALANVIAPYQVDYVLLLGFMRVLTPAFLDRFPMRVLNIHPALLPSFPGVHAQEQAFSYGVRVAGATVHFVDSGTDTGPIVAQAAVPVLEGDSETSLRARILRAEHALLLHTLRLLSEGRVTLEAGAVRPKVFVHGAACLFFPEGT